jgi:hypothetical protein
VLVSGAELHKRSSRVTLARPGSSGLESCAEDVRLKEVGQEGVNLALYVAFLDAVSLIAVPKLKNKTLLNLILDETSFTEKNTSMKQYIVNHRINVSYIMFHIQSYIIILNGVLLFSEEKKKVCFYNINNRLLKQTVDF